MWDANVLHTFARHYKTGKPLPDELLQRHDRKARNLGSGMLAEHQFYYGLVDMPITPSPDGKVDTTTTRRRSVPAKASSCINRFRTRTSRRRSATSSGYQAGYYGYQWSLVYAEDMFQRFKELGMLDPKAGMYYRKKILARGGTVDGLHW